MLLLGALSAIASCITGYLLANSGDYDGKLVSNHQWMGIVVAILSTLLWLVYQKVKSTSILGIASISLISLISITGHLGGSLTHGSDYLTAPLQGNTIDNAAAIPPIIKVQEAQVYQNAIEPLLKNRCYSCHGLEKQKGKLRLDQEVYILKGGKGGSVLVKGNAEKSEIMRRLLLPLNDEEHMAPKEKPQLTENEIKLLGWWIDNGADFKKKFKELPQPENIKVVLKSLQTGEVKDEQSTITEIPTEEVAMVEQEVINRFTAKGISLSPVNQQTNYLSANFINSEAIDKEVLDLLKSIKKQLIWLKLENKNVNDKTLNAIKDFKNLTNLSLKYSSITDAGLAQLKDLDQLQSLNLVGTNVSIKGIQELKKLKNLKFLYVYQTKINKSDLASIKKLLPSVSLDTGNYSIPMLAKDTTEFK